MDLSIKFNNAETNGIGKAVYLRLFADLKIDCVVHQEVTRVITLYSK